MVLCREILTLYESSEGRNLRIDSGFEVGPVLTPAVAAGRLGLKLVVFFVIDDASYITIFRVELRSLIPVISPIASPGGRDLTQNVRVIRNDGVGRNANKGSAAGIAVV